MLTRFDQREILLSLHAGVLEAPLWDGFLSRLAQGLEAGGCALRFLAEGQDWAQLRAVSSMPAGGDEPGGALSPVPFIPWRDLRPGRVYALDEFLMPGDSGQAAILEGQLEPAGQRYQRFVRIEAPRGEAAWLVVWRAGSDFSAADSSFLADLAPHLALALKTHAALEQERSRAGVSLDQGRDLSFGWIALDERGHVLEIEPRAADLLRRSRSLRIHPRGRLTPASPQADRAIAATLRDMASDRQPRARLIRLSEDPWLDLLLVPAARGGAGPAATARVATAYLHGDLAATAARIGQLRALFRLAPSEARLAVLLMRGASIAEAAHAMGITGQTARGYSKSLYAKTGARGQAELVRILLASAASLA